nr:hypothetical protein [Fredinandcohnia onubensis]
MNSGSTVVDEIGQINFQGNVIPTQWFAHIRFPNGKPHVLAIMILSEIVYWYRPKIIRDESTGRIISCKKKFKADKLQRKYESFAEEFGFSKRQAKEAVDLLFDMKVINREFRTITTDAGIRLNNVMFLEPIVENLKKITFSSEPYYIKVYEGHTSKRNIPYVRTEEAGTLERKTNTETSCTEISFASAEDNAHTCEGESDGVLTTDPSSGDQQGTVAEISHTPEAEKALLDHFISLRGYGFDASADDVAAAKEILSAGVSLQDALVWLTQRFGRYKPKHPRDRINSLSYCAGFILDKHVEKLKLSEGEERGTGEKIHKPSTGVRRSAPKAESITGNQVGRIRRKNV